MHFSTSHAFCTLKETVIEGLHKKKFFVLSFFALIPPLLIIIFDGSFFQGSIEKRGAGRPFISAGTYAVLLVDEGADENIILERLKANNIDIENIVCSANTSALLNRFSGIEEIAINKYFDHIEPFDPRNDGYAEKALKFFVEGGKRRLFIPQSELKTLAGGEGEIIITKALQDIDAELIYPSYTQNSIASIVLFFIAAAFLLLITRKISRARDDKYIFIYTLFFMPSFMLLARQGPGAFVICALYLTLFQILRQGAARFLSFMRCEKNELSALNLLLKRLYDELGSESKKIISIIVLFIIVCIISAIPALLALVSFLCFAAVFCCIALSESFSGRFKDHVLFVFIPIRSSGYGVKKFPVLPIPFLASAFLLIIFSYFSPQGGAPKSSSSFAETNALFKAGFPSIDDYERHKLFQQGFSYRRLNAGGAVEGVENEDYLHWSIDNDKLLGECAPESLEALDFPNSAGFKIDREWTLGTIISFLKNEAIESSDEAKPLPRPNISYGLIAALLGLCLYMPFVWERAALKFSPFKMRERRLLGSAD